MGVIPDHGIFTGVDRFFEEEQVMNAIDSVPSQFTIFARNSEKNVDVGGEHFALLPGCGAPFIIDSDGEQRDALMECGHASNNRHETYC